ncbi:MAG: radical SAM-associated putative lipoprotein [Alistipes sp.]|nr:radical SAM-associated putative lipoprotein [Alistipes sp.]
MKKFIYLLLALLGVSCDIGMVMYGSPHISFSLKARVVDEAGNPIQGIEVRSKEGGYFTDRTGVSDYLGNIDAHGGFWPGHQYEVVFYDIDGPLNGGEFEALEMDISDKVVQTEEGDGNWNGGTYVAELGDVTMTLKSEDAQEEENTTEEE